MKSVVSANPNRKPKNHIACLISESSITPRTLYRKPQPIEKSSMHHTQRNSYHLGKRHSQGLKFMETIACICVVSSYRIVSYRVGQCLSEAVSCILRESVKVFEGISKANLRSEARLSVFESATLSFRTLSLINRVGKWSLDRRNHVRQQCLRIS